MPESRIQQWRTRPIFISSTFRDMHAERDRLRQHVFPRLEEELLKRRHHLEWLDLRQGVESGAASTEEERELLVLKVCLDEIKRSRPFLIVLLGDRYGWVPPADRMDAAAEEAGFSAEVHGRSVTALEIEFGILKESPNQLHRCFFYFREPLPYDEMPPEARATYSEQFADDDLAAERWFALEELKKRLTEDDDLKPRIRPYSAGWDPEKNTVTGLEKWGDDVFEDLWHELEKETREFAARPAPTWEEIERDALAEFVEQRSRDFTGRDDVTRQLLDLAKSSLSPPLSDDLTKAETPAAAAPSGACVTGPPGAGKSALFAKLVSELERDPNVLLLANAAGTSPRSASVDPMLRRWIAELAAFLGVSDPLPEKASVEEVDQTFASLLGRASMKQRVVVLLDALNQFEPTPRAQHMTWRPKLWPPNARLVATALPGTEAESLSQFPGVEEIELPPLTEADAREIAHGVWKRYRSPWSDAVWQALAAKTLPDTGAAVGNPLWTTLACEQLALLDADDFTRAERQFAEERDPQARLTQLRRDLAQRMPPDVPGLYAWLLSQTEKIHGEAWARAFAVAIALSRHGWRERDLRVLVPALAARLYPETPAAEMTPLQLAALRRSFRAHLAVRGELQQWDFFHAQMREAIARRNLADAEQVRGLHLIIVAYLASLPQPDPLTQSEAMSHLIGSNDLWLSARYYGGPMTADEEAGATSTVISHILAGASQEPNKNLEWVISLASQGLPEDRAGIARRFLIELDEALAGIATLDVRLALLRSAEEALSKLTVQDPNNSQWMRWLGIADTKIGGILRKRGDSLGALIAYRAALAIAESCAAVEGAESLARSDVAVANDSIGQVLEGQGDSDGALQAYRAGVALTERLAALAPTHQRWQRDLAGRRLSVARVLQSQGKAVDAIGECRAAITLFESLASAESGGQSRRLSDPTTAVWPRDLYVAHYTMGRLLEDQGNMQEALRSHRTALEIAKGFVQRNPSDRRWQDDLAGSHRSVATVLAASGDFTGALDECRSSLAISERLVSADPSDLSQQVELAGTQQTLADLLVSLRLDAPAALEAYRSSLLTRERLVAADSINPRRRRDLALSFYRLGRFLQLAGDNSGAVKCGQACRAVLLEMKRREMRLDDLASRMLAQIDQLFPNAGE